MLAHRIRTFKLPNRIRIFNKYVTNRLLRGFANLSLGPFAIIRHVGRRSGKLYETVIWVWPLGEGFVIALTYGVLVDWYRNRLSSSHQKQESTSDSSPWFKNGSVSALANCRQILFTQKENRHEKSDCLRVRVIGRGRGKPCVDLSIRERRTGAV